MVVEILKIAIIVLFGAIILLLTPIGYALGKDRIFYRTQINHYILRIMICFGIGIFIDFLRTAFFIFSLPIYPFADQVGFCSKFILFFLAIYYQTRLVATFVKQSGHKIPYENLQRMFYISGIAIISFLCVVTSFPLPADYLGVFTYSINPILWITIMFLMVPHFAFIFFECTIIIRGLTHRKIKTPIIIAMFLFACLFFERFLSLTPSYLIPYNYLTIFLDLLVLLSVDTAMVLLLLKMPDIYEAITASFNFMALYLMKDNGDFILNYQVQDHSSQSDLQKRNLLLGGMVCALSKGSEYATEGLKSKIRSVNLGNNKLFITHGSRTFGVLYLKDHSPLLERKLTMLIEKFEALHKKELTDWKGNLADIDIDGTLKMIHKIFD